MFSASASKSPHSVRRFCHLFSAGRLIINVISSLQDGSREIASGASATRAARLRSTSAGSSCQRRPEASLAGTAIYPDDAIPITVKVNQEPVFCVRSDDFMLWHSTPRTVVMEEPLSGSMGVRFLLQRLTATMLHRYPSAIAAVTGSGMKAQQGATEYSYS